MQKHCTDAELIVLGLIAESPRYGYELEQIIEERGIREWVSLGFSSIYYLLDKLESQGLASSTVKDHPGNRKVFTITKLGRDVCAENINDVIRKIQPVNSSLLVGIANSPLLDHATFISALQERDGLLKNRLLAVATTMKAQQPLPDFVEAIFDYSISLMKAERAWLAKTVTNLDKNMDKIDIRKELKELYAPSSKEFSIVDVPSMSYIMIDGRGNPNTAKSYIEAVEALYTVSYALKFASKKQLSKDYVVLPLEGLWSADDLGAFAARAKDDWHWTMMIMQPKWITNDMVNEALASVKAKKNPVALSLLRFERYDEGKSVQILHIGSYDDEAPTLHRLHNEFIPAHNLQPTGRHHEIYIGDPRKTEPSKLKTILRQPVK